MRVVLLGGSLRPASLNGRLLSHLGGLLESMGHGATLFRGEALRMPLYQDGLPAPAEALSVQGALLEAQGLVIVSPEYNAGIPGHLKNAVDWVSTLKPSPWTELPVLLCACSPGALGGARGLIAWRATLANMGALAVPSTLTVPGADRNLDADGAPTDPRTREFLRSALDSFLSLADRVNAHRP
jgi:chromate reductase, NAD(P)H dehydrogenase (quinone)